MSKNQISLTVDSLVFGYRWNNSLDVLLIKRKNSPFKDHWAIPGGFVEQDESLHKATLRELKEETGLEIPHIRQFYAFGDPNRDPRGHIVSIAHYALIKVGDEIIQADSDAKEVGWQNLLDLSELAFDHLQIIRKGAEYLASEIVKDPQDEMFGDFSSAELQELYKLLKKFVGF